MKYYSFNEPALNGFNPELSTKYQAHPLYHLLETISVPVRRLEEILDENLPPHTTIDFLSVDVEGLDLEVLRSNNWRKYRPKVILAESWGSSLDNIYKDEVYIFLHSLGYELHSKTTNTLIFEERK